MSHCIRHLFSSVGRWQIMTSSLPLANQHLSSHHHPCLANRGSHSRVLRGALSPMLFSERFLHSSGRHEETISSTAEDAGLVGRVGTKETSDGDDDDDSSSPAGSAECEGSWVDDLDLGKTYIPPSSTDSLVFNGLPYYELPIIHIKATYNNTHINITDHTGRKSYTRTTCGAEGFKNAKKGTAIAAQTAGIAAAAKALDRSLKTVRVLIKGIGPGRQSSIKGLQMGGLDIVSITDNTPVPHNGRRPRKARRI